MTTGPSVDELIEQQLSGESARRLKLFAERLFAREPADLHERLSPEQRLRLARSALEFFSRRTEPIAVRAVAGIDGGRITIVETATADCPFIVDSLLEYFHAVGAPVRCMLHPMFRVARDFRGALTMFESASAREEAESFIHAELEIGVAPKRAAEIAQEVRQLLTEVHRATGDFERMTARAFEICEETAAERGLVEVREFLRWLVQGGFVFLGYRSYHVEQRDTARVLLPDRESGLGILADYPGARFQPPGPLDRFTDGELELLFNGLPPIISKTLAESHVHRRRPMDSIMIRRTDARGQARASDRFVGLYTSKAYAEEAQHIPVLRAKLAEVLRCQDAVAGSHDYKEIVSIFNSFPKEELLRASVAEICEQMKPVLDLKSERAVRLTVLSDPNRGHVIALVVMPREAFSAEVRFRIQNAIEKGLGGKLIYYYLALGEGYTARLHFCFAAAPPHPATVGALANQVGELARTWDDRFREQTGLRFGARASEILARWGCAFTEEYKAATGPERAGADVAKLEELLAGGSIFAIELNLPAPGAKPTSELRIQARGEAPMLSELMPMLQNFGIEVASEDVHQLSPLIGGQAVSVSVQSFLVLGPQGERLDAFPGAALVADAIAAVRAGKAEDDALNALTLRAALSWREAALLRTYLAAAFQMRLAPARPTLRRLFLTHPGLARILVDLFAARLGADAEAPARAEKLRASYLEGLGAVENLTDDRIARALLSMVEATVRTNYFLAPAPYIALKFESSRIVGLPETPPLYEIYVNSPQMEGNHLRAGRVARGGIRFSDRPDDFRTEILELMKTQTVKNAVIVPTGAKGGFVVKPPRAAGATAPGTGIEAYQTLINAMLDLTDNISEAGVVHPDGVKVLDNDGPYLVVAADKGTATFSDIANRIALARVFWLGDAFASGGEHGYDHKRLGITARGAWESAKRHLREMGRDLVHGTAVTMVGIGDMSGDVFGNGLIYSQNLKLIAAFDHRHIFIDPDPDPCSSFAERKRLFALPRSSWADYNPALISKGGGVFRRGQKQIVLSPEARSVLQCESAALDGESLIRTILRASVDILYNGGIGIYVRASDETDAEVGDHANDGCRVTAAELRAKIVTEGGNLGFTHKARIEYALNGGKINTDAIDNSAGVDTSDHEVNLKILLDPEVHRGALTADERNRILAECVDEVATQVLRDNRDQALSLSLEQARSRAQVSAFRDHMQAIEERGPLRRSETGLPSREALRDRRARYPGLTRPELAIVTAYTKIDLALRLEHSAFVDDPYLVDRFLVPYFPRSVVERFRGQIAHHRLRRELVATRTVNELVDLMGSTFVFGIGRDYGGEAHDAVRAWIIGGDLIDLQARTQGLHARSSQLSAEAELAAFLALEYAARSASAWALANCPAEMAIGEAVARLKPAFAGLDQEMDSLLVAGERERFERFYRELRATVHEEELAHGLARLAFTHHLLNVLGLSFSRGVEASAVARAYFLLSEPIDFSLLESALSAVTSDDRWERRSAQDLVQQLMRSRSALCSSILSDPAGPEQAIERLKRERERYFNEVGRLIAQVRALPAISLAALHVAVSAISRLAHARPESGLHAAT